MKGILFLFLLGISSAFLTSDISKPEGTAVAHQASRKAPVGVKDISNQQQQANAKENIKAPYERISKSHRKHSDITHDKGFLALHSH